MKKGVLRNFTKIQVCNKIQPQACNIIKKETLAHVFSCEFCEISKNTFFTEHLRVTRSIKALIKTALLVFAKKINPYSKRNENLISFSGRLSLLECLG